MQNVKVWDILIRTFHWSVVVIILVNFTIFDEGSVHEFLGYILMGLLLFRLIWGFVGTKHARFINFFPTRSRLKHHLEETKNSKVTSYVGHNPLGALMIFNLYATLILLSLTGYMAISDSFWGVEWVEEIHEFFANYLIFSVLLHIAGAVYESLRTGVNLIYAMITGIKKIP